MNLNPKKIKTVCVPLDPDDCGSVVHGYVRFPELAQHTHGKKLWYIDWSASISLSDCNRVIQWSLTGGEDDGFNVEKIDRAIGALAKMREYMVAGNIEMKKAIAERKRRNIPLDPQSED